LPLPERVAYQHPGAAGEKRHDDKQRS